jgi:hypothetical protein
MASPFLAYGHKKNPRGVLSVLWETAHNVTAAGTSGLKLLIFLVVISHRFKRLRITSMKS